MVSLLIETRVVNISVDATINWL